MKPLSVSEVRHRLPALVQSIARTREPVIVTRYGEPLAMLVPIPAKMNDGLRYPLRGQPISVADTFDTPMPELWEALAVADGGTAYSVSGRKRTRKG